MKKVININFQGRVIPIEETAYEILKQYIESLRQFFANEEGKEEIITGEVPYSYDLFHLFQENGWLNIRRGVASIRESRAQRRAMSA